jgi:hypothetical protein
MLHQAQQLFDLSRLEPVVYGDEHGKGRRVTLHFEIYMALELFL